MIRSKSCEIRGFHRESKMSGIRIAMFLVFTFSNAQAAILSENSYSMNQESSPSALSLPVFVGGAEGALVQALDLGSGSWDHLFDRENVVTFASRIALNVTAVGYILSFNYGSENYWLAPSMDNVGRPLVAVITDMIRASHTFQSGVRSSQDYNQTASFGNFLSPNLSE